MKVLVTRARDDAEALAALLEDRGIGAMIDPMLEIEPISGPDMDLTAVQAILVTSANGVRALARRSTVRDVAVFAVGDASARAAEQAGFVSVATASGDVETLAGLVKDRLDPNAGTVIHVAGSHVAGDLAGRLTDAGFTTRREVVYQARRASALSAETQSALTERGLDGVLLYSPRTAAIFANLAIAADLAPRLAEVTAYCLSPAVAGKADQLPWRRVAVAGRPDQESLLELLEPEADE
jgi:uroporphyrinogen-III synthase